MLKLIQLKSIQTLATLEQWRPFSGPYERFCTVPSSDPIGFVRPWLRERFNLGICSISILGIYCIPVYYGEFAGELSNLEHLGAMACLYPQQSRLLTAIRGVLSDSFFWFKAGRTLRDRLRLLYYWLSPRLFGHRPGPPAAAYTRFLGGRPIYLRSGSTDMRMLRSIFDHEVYHIPGQTTGEISSIIDLGAYTGLSTLYFADRYPKAKIVAVEPDTSNFYCLQRNVHTLSDPARVTVLNACISDNTGAVRFNMTGPSWARSIAAGVGTEVRCLTVTDLLVQVGFDHVDLLKMDIEGAERLAFQSVDEWLPRARWVRMEIHPPHMSVEELVNAMCRHGRTVFFRALARATVWEEISASKVQQLTRDNICLDVLIPPANETDRVRRAASAGWQ